MLMPTFVGIFMQLPCTIEEENRRGAEMSSLRVAHSVGAKHRGRNGEVLCFPPLPRRAKTGVSNGAVGARLRVWFWTPMEQRMVAEATPCPDPAEQRNPTRGVRVWVEDHPEGG